jgi:cation:H+ antiporter
MLVQSILLILGLILLIKGSGIFVGSASNIAKKWGVSEFVIGLTLVALGTSLPELTSSIIASVKNESGLVLGTIIGASIANLTLIIGIAALNTRIKVEKQMLNREGYLLFFVVSLLILFLLDSKISRIEGVVFLLFYLSYNLFLMESKSKLKKDYNFSDFAQYFIKFGYLNYVRKGLFLKSNISNDIPKKKVNTKKDYLFLLIGLIIVYFSANLVVGESIYLANFFLVSPIVLGVILSIGTTLPELSIAIAASKKRFGTIAIGNSIGSSITNILLVLGLASIIRPLQGTNLFLFPLLLFLAASTLFVIFFIKTDYEITKKEGLILVLFYLLFLARMFFF